jgi:hypothetical protein
MAGKYQGIIAHDEPRLYTVTKSIGIITAVSEVVDEHEDASDS